eukprot:3735742-Amphidinium_carterae.1
MLATQALSQTQALSAVVSAEPIATEAAAAAAANIAAHAARSAPQSTLLDTPQATLLCAWHGSKEAELQSDLAVTPGSNGHARGPLMFSTQGSKLAGRRRVTWRFVSCNCTKYKLGHHEKAVAILEGPGGPWRPVPDMVAVQEHHRARALHDEDRAWILSNMSKRTVLNAELVAPGSPGTPTCTSGSRRELDFAVISSSLMVLLRKVCTDTASLTRPHTLVWFVLDNGALAKGSPMDSC